MKGMIVYNTHVHIHVILVFRYSLPPSKVTDTHF